MADRTEVKMQTERALNYEVYGSERQNLRAEALETLLATSRTFFIPISRLPDELLEAVGSGYLCMRAIDEIEDHPELSPELKVQFLHLISQAFQASGDCLRGEELSETLESHRASLPDVTVRVCDWARMAPQSIGPRIWDATATMADRMADWVVCDFQVRNEADLDRYTFGVAGAVGLMLSDIWAWYDGIRTSRVNAIGFGRGLQAVNILRNHAEDLARGVDFYPNGWTDADMHAYARRNLAFADRYLAELPDGPAKDFCRIPLVLAYASIDALAQGRPKLTREEVVELVAT